MSFADFNDKFLRIAGRSKETGNRRSPIHQRKFTGAKGIGRLSSHKLGSQLALESTPDLSINGRTNKDTGFRAEIDWERIEANELSLDDAHDILARPVDKGTDTEDSATGTLLTIHKLHSQWTPRQLNNFLAEVRSTRPDPVLVQPFPRATFLGEALVPTIQIADTGEDDPGFTVELSGELEGSDAQWPTLLAHVNWAIEIDARDPELVVYQITPAKRTLVQFPEARTQRFEWRRDGVGGPRFVSRIFVRSEGRQFLPDLLARFASQASGIRLFFEGFRVLPYGSARNDWLGLDQGSSRREKLEYLSDVPEISDRSPNDERTYQLSNANYFGAVFLHDRDSAGLQMVVNREGFLPGEDLDVMTEIVRRGINISVRLRAALGAESSRQLDEAKRAEREQDMRALVTEPNSGPPASSDSKLATPRQRVATWVEAGREAAFSLRSSEMDAVSPENRRNAAILTAALDEILVASKEAGEEQAQLRVLASLGTQLGTFVHEVNGLLGQARVVRDLLEQLLEDEAILATQASRIRAVRRAQSELIASLERQAVYLSDSLGAEARRRRARQGVRERWETAARLLGGAAERRGVRLVNAVPTDLKTPPMFPSEMNVIFTNLLSNAIKSAAQPSPDPKMPAVRIEPLIRVTGRLDEDLVRISIENTGIAVELGEAERWFRPFETTTSDIDAVLGQGLGLGLPLTRRIIEEYGGSIKFVKPMPGMATAVEVCLPNE